MTRGKRGDNFHRVTEIRQSNPCATLEEIGTQIAVSRERVRQILAKAQMPTRHYVSRQLYECLNCGKATTNRRFCSSKCAYEYNHPLVMCDYCGKLFRRLRALLCRPPSRSSNHYFCSRSCLGKWRAEKYGFKKGHKSLVRRKWDWELVWNKHAETGYGSTRLSRLMNIPVGTVATILWQMKKRRLSQ